MTYKHPFYRRPSHSVIGNCFPFKDYLVFSIYFQGHLFIFCWLIDVFKPTLCMCVNVSILQEFFYYIKSQSQDGILNINNIQEGSISSQSCCLFNVISLCHCLCVHLFRTNLPFHFCSNIVDVSSYGELKEAISEGKWARGPWSARQVNFVKPFMFVIMFV